MVSNSLSNNQIYNLCKKTGNFSATVKTYIGYAKNSNDLKFFSTTIRGKIVKPRGKNDFGYGPLFKPKGFTQTYGEMDRTLKFQISSRAKAIKKLKKYLLT